MPKYARRPNGTGTAVKRGKTWQARVVLYWYEKDGHKVPKYNTKDGFLTRREALLYCQQLKTAKEDTPTLEEVYDVWKPAYELRVTKSTMGCYQAALTHFQRLKPLVFADIDIDDLQQCVDDCGQGKRTRENMKALMGLLYKYAIPRRFAPVNLAPYIHTGENDKGTRPAFTEEQVQIISKSKELFADYILSLIYTGMRPSELFGLKPDDYDISKQTLTGGIKTAAGKNRIITVSPKIQPIMARQAKNKDWLFPREDGTQMTERYFRDTYFYVIIDKLGMAGNDLTPYSCRHTFSNLMKNVPGSDTDKAALMGHASPTMTKKYQSPDLKSLKGITDNL